MTTRADHPVADLVRAVITEQWKRGLKSGDAVVDTDALEETITDRWLAGVRDGALPTQPLLGVILRATPHRVTARIALRNCAEVIVTVTRAEVEDEEVA